MNDVNAICAYNYYISGSFFSPNAFGNSTGHSVNFQMPYTENEVNFSQPRTNKKYEEMSVIGNGAYGTVYKAKDLHNKGQFVAMKKVKILFTEEGIPVNTLREIAVLKRLGSFKHPNVVMLLDICHGCKLEQEQQLIIYLVFEHIEQDLETYIEKCSSSLGADQIKDISFQLLNGITFLHSNQIIHRDLKPQNILISNQGQVKIADFGFARIYDYNMALTPVVVTLWYRPPEVLLNRTYASPADVWSSGCIIAELYRKRPLFAGENEINQLTKIFEVIGSPLKSEWPRGSFLPFYSFESHEEVPLTAVVPEICDDGADLIKRMLLFSPTKRICCEDALAHPYFEDLGKKTYGKLAGKEI